MTDLSRWLLSLSARLLGLVRTVYGWVFAILFCCAVGPLLANLRQSLHQPALDKATLAATATLALFAVVFSAAFWTTLRRTRASKYWGLAASFLMAVPSVTFLLFAGWQAFWAEQRGWLPFMPPGLLGLLAFGLPYRQPSASDTPQAFLRPGPQRWLRILRSLYAWAFFAAAAFCLYDLGLSLLAPLVHQPLSLSGLAIDAASAAVLGLAWWTVFRNKPSSSSWAIAANCLVLVPPVLLLTFGYWRTTGWLPGHGSFPLLPIALFGLLLFSLPRPEPPLAPST